MFLSARQHFKRSSLLAFMAVLSATPVFAQAANFSSLTLSLGFPPSTGIVTGFTGGGYSLSAIANRDRYNRHCIGFGDPSPDHIIVLEKDFPRLKIQVNSGGHDTTLLIQGSDGSIRCGDDTGSNKDASVEDTNWKAGTYRVWVGVFNPGVERRYTLSIEE